MWLYGCDTFTMAISYLSKEKLCYVAWLFFWNSVFAIRNNRLFIKRRNARPKKVVFPEIGLVEIFLSNVYQNINIFNLKKKIKNKSTAKKKTINKQEDKKRKKLKKKREYLWKTRFDDIVIWCIVRVCLVSF